MSASRVLAVKATLGKLQERSDRAKLNMQLAIETYATLQAQIALAAAQLERLEEQG